MDNSLEAYKESLSFEELLTKCDPKFVPNKELLLKTIQRKDVPKNLIIDVDHTLTQAQWRDGMIGGDWDLYHSASKHDRPIEAMIVLSFVLSTAWNVVALTSRPEKWRGQTLEWFLRHNVRVDELIMRPDNDLRSSAPLKIAMAKDRFGEPLSSHVAFVIDDNEAVCAAFAAEGIPSLQIYSRIIK